jgi:DNA-binding CsgD family transcriptional regulator
VTWSRAALAEAEGRWLDAAPLYREAAAAYASLPRPYAQALTTEAAGRCALAADSTDPAGAEAAGAEAAAVEGAGAGVPGARVPESDAQHDDKAPGDAEDKARHKAQAVADLTASTRQFAELGAVWDAARARALLRSHQPAKEARPPGRPSYGDRLSPREREVAELAGTGLTNREIATTLHLSPRTVEQHVARAMRKLGTTSRQHLASMIDATVLPEALDGVTNSG